MGDRGLTAEGEETANARPEPAGFAVRCGDDGGGGRGRDGEDDPPVAGEAGRTTPKASPARMAPVPSVRRLHHRYRVPRNCGPGDSRTWTISRGGPTRPARSDAIDGAITRTRRGRDVSPGRGRST